MNNPIKGQYSKNNLTAYVIANKSDFQVLLRDDLTARTILGEEVREIEVEADAHQIALAKLDTYVRPEPEPEVEDGQV